LVASTNRRTAGHPKESAPMYQHRLSANTPMCMARFLRKMGLPAISSCPQWTSCAWKCSCKSFPNASQMISCLLPVTALPAIPQENSGCQTISCSQNCHRKAPTLTPQKITGTTCEKSSSTTSSLTQWRLSKTNSLQLATSINKIPKSSIPS
jgi:hypothetical protein